MAGSPRWKVYSASDEYIGSCKYLEDAAALCGMRDNRATIRDGHRRIVFTQGIDGNAGDSYDDTREIVLSRTSDSEME